jgi:WD40 repeat protein
MSTEPRVGDLLSLYEAARKQGRPLTAEELCQGCPELLKEMRRQVESLEVASASAGQEGPTAPAAAPAAAAGWSTPLHGAAPTMAAAGPLPLADLPGYEVLGELGRGGMGVVYRARQKGLDRVVALKMIRSGEHAGPEQRERFRREAEAVARLQHPNIVHVYEVGEHDGQPFFSLEYVDGGSLAAKLAGTPLPPREAARLVETLSRAVDHAHQRGVLHRDLKPANVLLAFSGRSESGAGLNEAAPKVTDFGLAKRLDADVGQTQSGAILGTPSYMAPEQAAGRGKDVGPAADVYALGAILYECLTGRPPFRAATPMDTLVQVLSEEAVSVRRLQPQVPRDLETVCLKCLAKPAHRRYTSAAELADDLQRFRRGEPVRARPTPAWERAVKWARRRPALAALAGVSTLAAAVLLVVGLGYDARLRVAWHAADDQRQKALTAGAETRQTLAALQDQFYLSQVLLAQRQWQANDVRGAEEALAACPADRRRWEWYFQQRQCHLERFTLRADAREATCVAFRPDGKLFATGDGDSFFQDKPGLVKVRDPATGRLVFPLKGHTACITGLTFSPDGKLLASASKDLSIVERYRNADKPAPPPKGEVILWDPTTGKELRRLKGFGSVAFSPDSKLVATAGFDQTVKVWGAATGEQRLALRGHNGRIGSVAFSPDGKLLASTSRDLVRDAAGKLTSRTQTKVWDVATRQARLTLPDDVGEVNDLAFHPDGKRLATAGADETVRVWDTTTGRVLLTLRGHGDAAEGVAFSADGKRLATAGMDQAVTVWDADTGQEVLRLPGHAGPVHNVAFAQAGAGPAVLLASASGDGTFKLWDLLAQNPRSLEGHTAGVTCVRFSPDGTRLASASPDDQTVRVWDVRTGKEIGRPLPGTVYALAFSPDGRRLAAGGGDVLATAKPGTLAVWDVERGQKVLDCPGHSRFVFSVAFSPDGKRLASLSADPRGGERGEVKVWDAATGQELASFRGPEDYLQTVAFSPDGRRLLLGGIGETVEVVEALTGKQVKSFRGRVGAFAVFSPDGRQVAAGCADGTLLIWDVESGRQLLTVRAHSGNVSDLAYSPDGSRLATAGLDLFRGKGQVKLWDVSTGKELLALPGQMSVAFSPDGHLLAAPAFADWLAPGAIEVWDATPRPAP